LASRFLLPLSPVYVTERKEVKIQENVALSEAVEKTAKAVVGVKTRLADNTLLEGTGVALTNDGLIVTLAELIPAKNKFAFFVEQESKSYQVLKRSELNLALIKLEADDLPAIGLADFEKLKLGQRVFLVGYRFGQPNQKVVNEGIIRSLSEDRVETNIFEEPFFQGSPLFDIEGNLIGLTSLMKNGRVQAIPISSIRVFTGF